MLSWVQKLQALSHLCLSQALGPGPVQNLASQECRDCTMHNTILLPGASDAARSLRSVERGVSAGALTPVPTTMTRQLELKHTRVQGLLQVRVRRYGSELQITQKA